MFKKTKIALASVALAVCVSAQGQNLKVLTKIIDGGVVGQVDGAVAAVLDLGCKLHSGFITMLQEQSTLSSAGDLTVGSQNSFADQLAKKFLVNTATDDSKILTGQLTNWLNTEKRNIKIKDASTTDVKMVVAPYPFDIDYSDVGGVISRTLAVKGTATPKAGNTVAGNNDIGGGALGTYESGLRCYSPTDADATTVTTVEGGHNIVRAQFNATKNRLCTNDARNAAALATKYGAGATKNLLDGKDPGEFLCPGLGAPAENDLGGGKCAKVEDHNLVLIRTAYEVGFLLAGNPHPLVDGTYWITESYFKPEHIGATGAVEFGVAGVFNVFSSTDISLLTGNNGFSGSIGTANVQFSEDSLPKSCIALSADAPN